MAKDNRAILRGIRLGVLPPNAKPDKDGHYHKTLSKTFSDGMEDELAAELDQKRLDELVAEGSLAGNWKTLKKAASAK